MTESTSVWAFEPRAGDAFFIAKSHEDLHRFACEYVAGEQCDDCGASLYRIEQNGRSGRWVAVSVTDDLGRQGCGREWPIGLRDENEVIFP
jgi:hypothetical protein